MKWTQSKNQDLEEDDRGWEKGRRRKWDQQVVERIKEIREELKEDPDEDFWGPSAVEVEYRKRHSDKEVPPARTIGQILTDLGLTDKQKHESKRGALRYLHYPETSLYEIVGDRLLEADFVGDKYITGRSEPIRFLGYSFKREPKVKYYQRVQGETTDAFLEHTEAFFDRFETPQAVKMDNATATAGGRKYKRTISRVMEYLLGEEVYPIYSVPRTPATQASIEGSNSMFSRKFWNRHDFETLEQIDERLETFNENIRMYHQYEPPEGSEEQNGFEPAVYFLRQVREVEQGEEGKIDVVNESVRLPSDYIKYFVLGEWKLNEEKLLVRFERREENEDEEEEQIHSEVIRSVDFQLHEASKKRCEELLG